MLTRYRASAFPLAVVAVWAVPAFAKPAPVSIARLVEASDVIVIGTTTDIISVAGVRVAVVQVDEAILASPVPEKIYYLAQRIWREGAAAGNMGERCILFLSRGPAERFETKRFGHQGTSEFVSELQDRIGANCLYTLSSGGRGRMVIQDSPDEAFVQLQYGVVAPRTVARIPNEWGFERLTTVSLKGVLEVVRQEVVSEEKARERQKRYRRTPGMDVPAFAIAPDVYGRYEYREGGSPRIALTLKRDRSFRWSVGLDNRAIVTIDGRWSCLAKRVQVFPSEPSPWPQELPYTLDILKRDQEVLLVPIYGENAVKHSGLPELTVLRKQEVGQENE